MGSLKKPKCIALLLFRYVGSVSCTAQCTFDFSKCQPLVVSFVMHCTSKPTFTLMHRQVLLFAIGASNITSPSLHGPTPLRVDHACQAEATRAGVPGSFVAMISPPGQHALHQDHLPVVNSKVS